MAKRSGRMLCVLACTALLLCLVSAASAAPSWNAFGLADIQGVTVTPAMADGVLTYTVELGLNSTITTSTGTYDIVELQGIYALSDDVTGSFAATDGSNSKAWVFSTSGSGGATNVAGWAGNPQSDRLQAGQSMTASFGTFDLGGIGVVPGFHVAYMVPGDTGLVQTSGFFKQGTPPMPEPSSLLGLFSGVAGMAAFVIRRKK